MSEGIRIERDVLYTRSDLATILEPAGINVDTFLSRLGPRKVFRMVWLGEDLLEAYREAPALRDEKPMPPPKNRGNRKGTGKIGGLFTREEVGL